MGPEAQPQLNRIHTRVRTTVGKPFFILSRLVIVTPQPGGEILLLQPAKCETQAYSFKRLRKDPASRGHIILRHFEEGLHLSKPVLSPQGLGPPDNPLGSDTSPLFL